jgi:hypothetical protein
MSQKTQLIEDAKTVTGHLVNAYYDLVRLMEKYKDNTWTVGGADEIVQADLDSVGLQSCTPAEFKSAIDTAVTNLQENMETDEDLKKFNALL